MTIKEFQAWLEGYSESFVGGYPNLEQWKKVKAKMALLSTFEHKPNPGNKTWRYTDDLSKYRLDNNVEYPDPPRQDW